VALSVSHQDQVITPPAGARTLARSAHTDHAMLAYETAPVMSLQGHPEFSDEFVAALYSARRGKSLTDAQVEGALASLNSPVDSALVGMWMVRFFRTAR
jgi:GMP synthase-like glutamine amidotransferase